MYVYCTILGLRLNNARSTAIRSRRPFTKETNLTLYTIHMSGISSFSTLPNHDIEYLGIYNLDVQNKMYVSYYILFEYRKFIISTYYSLITWYLGIIA